MMCNCPNFILQTGDTHQLIANVAPADADDLGVAWKSSNPSIATVNDSGLVSALTQGAATILVTTNDGGFTSSCNIGVVGTTTEAKNFDVSSGIIIYPNPASDKLFVEFMENDIYREIKVFNSRGQLIYSENEGGRKNQIDISRLETGLLVVQIKSRQGCHMQIIIKK